MIVVETKNGNILRVRCPKCKEHASVMGTARTRASFEKKFRELHAHDDPASSAEVSPSSDGEGCEE